MSASQRSSAWVAAALLAALGCSNKSTVTPAVDGAGQTTDAAPDVSQEASPSDGPAIDAASCGAGTIFCNGICLQQGQTAGGCTAMTLGPDVFSIALAGPYLYFSLIETELKRMPVAGGTIEHVSFDRSNDLIGNATHLYLYRDVFLDQPRMIQRLAVAGGAAMDLGKPPLTPTAFTIDGSNVYFVTEGGFNGVDDVNGPAVYQLALGGGAATAIGIAVKPNWIAADATHVYWGDAGIVWRTPKATAGTTPLGDGGADAGGATQVIDTRTSSTATSFAIDDQFVYWTRPDGTLLRAPKAGGGTEEVIATDKDFPLGYLATDDADVYVATHSYGPANRLLRYHKADRSTKVMATTGELSNRVLLDDHAVYLGSLEGVLKVTK